jgi:3-dehydroquinate synthase
MVGSLMSDTFNIKASRTEYSVIFSDNFQEKLTSIYKPDDVILVDTNILDIYKKELSFLNNMENYIPIKPDERLKSYQGVEPIIHSLIEMGFRKNHRLIAIGGGITQDITAFISSILYRGINWIFFPTTLLAQCDSCIGSKTSINFGSYKNQIGGFYPPHEIIIDTSFINSLSEIDKLSGLGEMTHYYLIAGRDDFEVLKDNFSSALSNQNVLKKLVLRSLMIKKEMVEKDEFDAGPRNIFNYGHTFGHAIESITDYAIPHGIAVSFGMDIANYISYKLGYISHDLMEETRGFLSQIWCKTEMPEIEVEVYKNLLLKDKKVIGKQLNCILTRGLGDMFKSPLDLDDTTMAWIRDCINFYRAFQSRQG